MSTGKLETKETTEIPRPAASVKVSSVSGVDQEAAHAVPSPGRSSGLGPRVMLRSHLTERLIEEHGDLTRQQVQRAVRVILRRMRSAMLEGRRVELRGFGSFMTRIRPAYRARNPVTRAEFEVPEGLTLWFRTGTALRRRFNPERETSGEARAGSTSLGATVNGERPGDPPA